MNRERALERLEREDFDVAIVGGGATGLGCAVDAASRGYRTALVEARDFSGGTSSRSTKLIHGGVRYLRQGNIALVREALAERAALLRNAPTLVTPLPFFVPARNAAERLYYAAGLRLYDLLARKSAVPSSRAVRGGVEYYDAQFDDARLAIALAKTAWSLGAAVANYAAVESFTYRDGALCGAMVRDAETGAPFVLRARCVINAAGIFADRVRGLDDAQAPALLQFSRGTHVVVPQDTLPFGDRALLVPKTADGRVLFALPWHGRVLAGTTDVAAAQAVHDPVPTIGEVDWILGALAPYANRRIGRADVSSAFAGLRPLVRHGSRATKSLSREHLVTASPSGLVTVTGGKWTTYRVMARDAVDLAARQAALAHVPSRTHELRIEAAPLDPGFDEAIEREMARTLDDLLGRRKRTLFVDAREAIAAAPQAVDLLAARLGRDQTWRDREMHRFLALAQTYIPA